MSQGRIIIVSGPSGVGKGTILRTVMQQHESLHYSVSATSRPMRPEDREGVSYYFVSRERFEEMIAAGELLEHACYAGNYYGTPLRPVEEALARGESVVLEIDVQRALQVMQRRPDAISVFIAPPSYAELKRRLAGRGDTPPDIAARRLHIALEECRQAKHYQYTIINDSVGHAVQELEAVLTAEACRTSYRPLNLKEKRELRRLVSRPLYLFCMVIAPLFCYIFFTTLMDSGLPTDMPVGVVDRDMTATSRQLVRNLDAFEQTAVVARYPDISDARIAMQKGEIYGFYYIPEGTAAKAQAQRQPKVSFYTNNTLLIAGSLLFKDMKMMSELASGAAARTALYAKGATEEQAMAFLQPIVIDTHPLNNPWLNYSVYLCNTFAPGVLMLLIFMITVYSIGVEIKDRTAREWLRTGNDSIWISLAGKLLPHTAVFFLMGILYNTYLYGFLHFPCNSGILPMLLATLCLVLASQGMGILMIGTLPTLRLGLSFASLWGVLSFSMCGLSFPAMAMHPVLQGLANLFPLRHYFLIYADQALNGYPMIYSWMNYVALLVFMMLPFLVARRLKEALIHYKYLP